MLNRFVLDTCVYVCAYVSACILTKVVISDNLLKDTNFYTLSSCTFWIENRTHHELTT